MSNPAHNTANIKKSKRSLIFSAACLAVSLVLAAGFVFAWFSITDKPQMDGSSIMIMEDDDRGYKFKQMNGLNMPGSDYPIYPGDTFVFEVEATRDNTKFGVAIQNIKLTEQQFYEKVLTRDDLTSGLYQKEDDVAGFVDFDIDKQLAATSLSAAQKNQRKADFLWQFQQSNSMFSAIRVTFLNLDFWWENTDIQLIPVDQGDGIMEYHLPDDYYEYISMVSDVEGIPVGTVLTVKIEYGYKFFVDQTDEIGYYFYPKCNFSVDGGASNNYRALNYNCFISQKLLIGFIGD